MINEFHKRSLPEHEPISREFRRIDENFVMVGDFVRFDPLDTSPNFVDPPHKRPKKNRHQRRAEFASERVVSDTDEDDAEVAVLIPRGKSWIDGTTPRSVHTRDARKQIRKRRKAQRRARRRQQSHMRTGN